MRSPSEISQLLDELDMRPADDLEDQDLDFKEWVNRSMSDAVDIVVEMAVCMANGGGGTVVFGVRDGVTGRTRAILGVPPEVDVNRLKKSVYDRTDPNRIALARASTGMPCSLPRLHIEGDRYDLQAQARPGRPKAVPHQRPDQLPGGAVR